MRERDGGDKVCAFLCSAAVTSLFLYLFYVGRILTVVVGVIKTIQP